MGFAGNPFLVVTVVTPFAALDPYREAASASLSTEILSISSGFSEDRGLAVVVMVDRSLVVTMTPSMTPKRAGPCADGATRGYVYPGQPPAPNAATDCNPGDLSL